MFKCQWVEWDDRNRAQLTRISISQSSFWSISSRNRFIYMRTGSGMRMPNEIWYQRSATLPIHANKFNWQWCCWCVEHTCALEVTSWDIFVFRHTAYPTAIGSDQQSVWYSSNCQSLFMYRLQGRVVYAIPPRAPFRCDQPFTELTIILLRLLTIINLWIPVYNVINDNKIERAHENEKFIACWRLRKEKSSVINTGITNKRGILTHQWFRIQHTQHTRPYSQQTHRNKGKQSVLNWFVNVVNDWLVMGNGRNVRVTGNADYDRYTNDSHQSMTCFMSIVFTFGCIYDFKSIVCTCSFDIRLTPQINIRVSG